MRWTTRSDPTGCSCTWVPPRTKRCSRPGTWHAPGQFAAQAATCGALQLAATLVHELGHACWRDVGDVFASVGALDWFVGECWTNNIAENSFLWAILRRYKDMDWEDCCESTYKRQDEHFYAQDTPLSGQLCFGNLASCHGERGVVDVGSQGTSPTGGGSWHLGGTPRGSFAPRDFTPFTEPGGLR